MSEAKRHTAFYKRRQAKKEEVASFYYPTIAKIRPEKKLEIDKSYFDTIPEIDTWLKAFETHKLSVSDPGNLPDEKFSEQEALEIVYEYYTSTNSKIANSFRAIFDDRKNNLVFSNNARHFDSGTTFIEDTGEVLMSVSFDGTISSLTNLVHEYAHAIGFKNKPTSWRTGAENSFIEIESYLHSILFLDFMDDHGYSADTNYERTAILNTAIESTSVLRKKKFLVMLYEELKKSNPNLTFRDFAKYLEEQFKISRKDFKQAMRLPADIVSPYVIGPYIAFELYNLYLYDPDYALFLFTAYTRIYATTPEDYFKQVENGGIKPGQNVESFTRKIKMRP